MAFSTVERTGWFSRIGSSFVGVLVGLLMIPGSVLLMGWNEYRTIHRTRGLNEGAATVESIPSVDEVASHLDGKLVHATGQATTEEILRDPDFAVSKQAIKLQRSTEMYQWVEHRKTREDRNTGGGKTRHTTYEYERKWHHGRENSSDFHRTEGHENPAERFGGYTKTAKEVSLGAYQLSTYLVGHIDEFHPLPWDDSMLSDLPAELREQVRITGDQLYWSAHGGTPEAPQLGDQRIRFTVVEPTEVSLIARQSGHRFAEFEVSNGEHLHNLYVGTLSAGQIFDRLRTQNTALAWGLRVVGLLLCTVGFGLILGPIAVLADIIPFIGSLTRGATWTVAMLLGVFVSSTTVALSWITVRPLIGIPLLCLAVWAIVRAFRSGGDEPTTQRAPQTPPPVRPPSPTPPPPPPA